MKPDGIFLSNGPGNPADNASVVQLIQNIVGKYPIFGMGLGYQLLCLASGAKVEKMKFGNHGSNHPVRNFLENKVEIVAHNHMYKVCENSLENTNLTVTHLTRTRHTC